MDAQKILLVGDTRICPQVAYVMGWQNYEQVNRLTDADVNKYADHKIVICDFKRRRRRYLSTKGGGRYLYLDDICRQLDIAEQQKPSLKDPVQIEPKSLLARIMDRIKTGQVGLAIVRRMKRPFTLRNFWIINKLPLESLKLSEMLIKVLYSKPTNIVCDHLYTWVEVDYNHNLSGCCMGLVPPFGNIVNADLWQLYNGYRARVIKLSALNHTYCLCDFRKCQCVEHKGDVNLALDLRATSDYPLTLNLATDKTCNLKCRSCRLDYVTNSNAKNEQIQAVHHKLLSAGWLTKAENVSIIMGEALYSPNYLSLLTSDWQRQQIGLTTNGLLFTPSKWEQIKDKYRVFNIGVSIDAATAATYYQLRGGDFAQLLKNLDFMRELHEQNKIHYWQINFVVQRDNYREMVDFVKLGKKLRVDRIHFRRLDNWGTMRPKQYRHKCLVIKNQYLARELYAVLQDPIFKDPIVDLTAFQPYLANSTKRYGE